MYKVICIEYILGQEAQEHFIGRFLSLNAARKAQEENEDDNHVAIVIYEE